VAALVSLPERGLPHIREELMEIVYAKYDGNVQTPDGALTPVFVGQHWRASDPVVKASPDMFSADPRFGLCGYGTPAADELPPVEQATAAPGERRGARVRRDG
jgi:hypothetical protein